MVENIEKTRQPYPTLDAIYFLTPCRESVLRLIDDFSAYKTPMYKGAYVHFTNGTRQVGFNSRNSATYQVSIGLDDQLFADLNHKLKSTGASEYIQSLKEMYVDFMGM